MPNQWMPKNGESSLYPIGLDIEADTSTKPPLSTPTEEEAPVLPERYSYKATLKIGFKLPVSTISQAEARRENQQLVEEYLDMVTSDHSEDPPAPVIRRKTS